MRLYTENYLPLSRALKCERHLLKSIALVDMKYWYIAIENDLPLIA